MAFTIFKKLARGLSRTRENLASTLQTVVGGTEIDEDALEDLEASLLAADLGPQLAEEVIQAVRERAERGPIDGAGLRTAVRETLRAAFPETAGATAAEASRPQVVFVVGVNGGGKTTTVGKLAARERRQRVARR